MRNTHKTEFMKTQRLTNLVGAMALTLSDEIVGLADALAPRGEPAAAIALIGRSSGVSIRALSMDLDLSHAATVRLVDRLALDQIVTRQRSIADGRAVELQLTTLGAEIYQQILNRRETRIIEVLAELSSDEKEILGKVSEKILVAIASGNARTSKMCRLCDVAQCRVCPIDAVRRERGCVECHRDLTR